MGRRISALKKVGAVKGDFGGSDLPFGAGEVLNALSSAVLVIDGDNRVLYANVAAEQMFAMSRSALARAVVRDLLPEDSPVFSLIRQVRDSMSVVTEHDLALDTPRTGARLVNVQGAPMVEMNAAVALSFHERSIADQIDHRLTHRDAARSISAMAAMLAHEIKNPLSGIRGAAQLLEQGVTHEDRELTQMIQEEANRIKGLVERMEIFSDNAPIKTEPLNIHQILGRVRTIAENGFARHAYFVEEYDPSLPPVLGNRDQLIQVFLNLVKNAAEALPHDGGEIVLSTAYKHGVRFAMPGRKSRVHLPLAVTIRDNGCGMSPDLQEHLFDPFVTTKAKGSGLGLALVAKIIGDHGGVIDFKTRLGRTSFSVLLPMFKEPQKD